MITAVFTDNSDYARATGLWQWDYGQRLRIEGLKLPTAVEIHFALTEQSGDAITRVGTTKDGVTEVVIPDSMLENQAAGATYEIYAWIYLADKTSGETIKRISMQVKRRAKPEGHDTPEDAELFREAIAQVNASADRAETAREGAEAAQKAAEAAAGKIEGEITGAGQIAEQVKQDAEAVAKDKQAVSQMVTETTQNAQKAAEAAQVAESSSTAAKEAQTAAESAEAGAEAAMEEVERDRVEVSETHKAVEQLREAVDTDRQAVAADRQAVENTALQFGQAAQIAINAVGQAQEAAVGAVSAEGQRQTTAVQRAGTQAVSGVAEAKTKAVQAVTTEGDTQTKRVQDAAAGIVADREQIAANKQAIEGKVDKQQGADNAGKALVVGADGNVELGDAQTKTDPTLTQSGQAADAQVTGREIATLHQKKADAIIETAQGETMILTDSSDKLFEGLRVFGKSTQDGTPSVENPVPIVNAGEGGSITVEVTGRNLFNPQGDMFVKQYDSDSRKPKFENGIFYSSGKHGISFEIMNAIKVTPKETYTLSYEIVSGIKKNAYLATFESIDPNGKFINKTEYDFSKTKHVITVPENHHYICFSVIGDDYYSVGIRAQLEYGSAQLPYEPYNTHQSLTLATPNGLPGVPVDKDGNYTDQNGQQWVCDEIDLGRGKYVQRVLKTKPNKTIVFSNRDENGRCAIFDNSLFGTKWMNGTKQALSSIAQWSEWGNRADGTFALAANGIYYKDSMKTLEEVNAMFAKIGTDFEICGVLAAPIERDLTPEEIAAYEALHTNYPTTVITNDAGAHMEASYVADTGTYIRNMEERLSAKLVNIQSALISQKISGGGIKVTDSSRVPVVRFAMWGKTEQRKTTGKNLFDIKGETTFSKGTFDIKDNLIDCTLADTWGGSYIMFSKEYPAGEYTFSADKMRNGAVQKIAILLTVEPLSYSVDSCAFNDYYKNYLIKNNKTLSRNITFKVDSPFEIGIPLSGDNDVVGETLSIKNIQLERGASATAYEPYTGGKPSPSPDWEQPIEITDQPVTVTVKGGTEQQSITLTPPRPFTKWDKLEKVGEVWCWVYQSKVLSGAEIKENYKGVHSSGAVMISVSTLGVADGQNDAVSDKFIYSTQSVVTLKNGEFRIAYGNVYLKIDGVVTAEEGKQWLESNNITIIAQASTPESIPLSPSEQDKLNALTMYAGTTEVTNTGGCNMELTYTVDTKSYVDSKIAAISAAVLEV